MRKRRQSLRTKRKQPKIKTKGMGLQRDAALFLCNRKRAVSGAPGEGIRHVGFFMFGNVQKKLDGQWRIEREKGTDYRGDGRMRRVPQ